MRTVRTTATGAPCHSCDADGGSMVDRI
jgi:hypothetical protein